MRIQTKKRFPLIFFSAFIILLTGIFVFSPQIDQIGIYRDDWNNYYNAITNGTQKLIEHYSSDRPADGYLIAFLYGIFGTHNTAYLLYNLFCRIIGGLFFTLTLFCIWKNNASANTAAGVLYVVFPGFLQQIEGISYVPHQTAMLAFCASLFFSILAIQKSGKLRYILIAAAVLLSIANAALMEYYIGLEAVRLVMINVSVCKNQQSRKENLKNTLILFAPYAVGMILFVIWRSFVFSAQRSGTDVMSEIITPLLSHPRYEGLSLLARIFKNIWKLFIGAWTVPLFSLTNGIDMKLFWSVFSASIIPTAICIYLFCEMGKNNPGCDIGESLCGNQWIRIGLISGILSILPLIFAGRDINYSSSLDRFSLPGSFGAVLFLVGLLLNLKNIEIRKTSLFLLILSSVFVQTLNKTNYINTWKETQDYWQQMIWRIPSLEKGTVLVSSGGFSPEEDYELFAPADLIYYPEEKEYSPIGAEILNSSTIKQIEMGETDERTIRGIYVIKDYTKLLAVTKPTSKSCLQIIDGSNPIYSESEWSKIPVIGKYSSLSQINTEENRVSDYPFFLPSGHEYDWCCYYQTISLELQRNNPSAAAILADEAVSNGLKAEDSVEWIPLIDAYAQTGNPEKADPFIAILKSDSHMKFSACTYFRNKNNEAIYKDVINSLCC